MCSENGTESAVAEASYSSWQARRRFGIKGKDKMAHSKRNTGPQKLEDEGVKLWLPHWEIEIFHQKAFIGIQFTPVFTILCPVKQRHR